MYADEVSAGGIHFHDQFSLTIIHVPYQLAGIAVPAYPIGDWSIRRRGQDFLSTMFLGSFEYLVGVNLQKGRIKDLRIGIVGRIVAVAAIIDPACRRILRIGP